MANFGIVVDGNGGGGGGGGGGSSGGGADALGSGGFFDTDFGDESAEGSMSGGGGGGGATFGGGGGGSYVESREGQLANPWTGAYDDEPPLLEELGVNLGHIWRKTAAVLHPTRKISADIMDDTDMAGPLVVGLLLGVSLMLRGKLHFGYIYGFGLVGCVSLWLVLNLLSDRGIDVMRVVSVLGYGLLPMVALALCRCVLPLNGLIGLVLAGVVVAWSTRAAANMFVAVLHMVEQRALVAYPTVLFYSVFALLAIG